MSRVRDHLLSIVEAAINCLKNAQTPVILSFVCFFYAVIHDQHPSPK